MSSPDMFDFSQPTPNSQTTSSTQQLSHSNATGKGLDHTPPSQTPEDVAISPTPPTPEMTPTESSITCAVVKVEFLDSEGRRISSRTSHDPEVVSILASLMRSNSKEFAKATANKVCESNMFGELVEERVVKNISDQFQKFVKSEKCPLRIGDLLESPNELAEIDFGNILEQCQEACPNLVNALCVICLGCDGYTQIVEEGGSNKYQKQRLLALLAIGAFTRNQKVNLYQKICGEFLKRRNTSKNCLQFLQRVGLSLVSMSIRSDQQKMGSNFLEEVTLRKAEIESWARQKKVLERAVKNELIRTPSFNKYNCDNLAVDFIPDSAAEAIEDLGVKASDKDDELSTEMSAFLRERIVKHGTARDAMEAHLDSRPKIFDVTYDNIGTIIVQFSQIFHL